jgi:hypothetical protein
MLPPAVKEENVLKVLDWLSEDISRYPITGQKALDASVVLTVSFAEVNIANRRIRFGLMPLVQKPVIKDVTAKPLKTKSEIKE